MKIRISDRTWLLLLLLVLAIVVLAVYFFSKIGRGPEKELFKEKTPLVESDEFMAEDKEGIADIMKEPLPSTPEKTTVPKPSEKVDPCAQLERDIAEYFNYLDGKPYIRELGLKTNTYIRFKEILKRLMDRPPVPAGEGNDPKILVNNIHHFFRVLGKEDLLLIYKIIENEQETVEADLRMFYRWLLSEECRLDRGEFAPSMKVMYRYAGFFVNTIGGRAYLNRRTSSLRLLVSYYCLLILHEADKKGKNIYGIDIFTPIPPVKHEISHYNDFQFQKEYLDHLTRIENYYIQKRQP